MPEGGRTDMTKLMVAFRKFGKAPKNHISLHNIHWSVFLKEEICVLCEVRTDHLYPTQIHFILQKVNEWLLNRFLQDGQF